MSKRFYVIVVASMAGIVAVRRADFTAFAGDVLEEAAWQVAAGGNVPLENFEEFTGVPNTSVGGDVLTSLPSLHVTFECRHPASTTTHNGAFGYQNVVELGGRSGKFCKPYCAAADA